MRKASVVKGFKNSQKIRIIVNGVGLYTTVGDSDSIFSTTYHRQAVQQTLHLLAQEKCGGIGHTVTVYDHRLDRQSVQVQVDLL